MIEVLNDTSCNDIVSGGMRYDPSVDQLGHCGFQRTTTASPDDKFCAEQPPETTQRFCPCSGTSITGELVLHVRVQCPERTPELKRRSELQCADSNGEEWSNERRTLCCCTTGRGCLDKDTFIKAVAADEVGMALERGFADGVGVRMRHLALLPPPEIVKSHAREDPHETGAEDVRWRYTMKADNSSHLASIHCGQVHDALRTVDWTAIFKGSVNKDDVPLPHTVSASDADCSDWQCAAWEWNEEGTARRLPAARAEWCCSQRGVGCGESHLWIFFWLVGLINVVGVSAILYFHCKSNNIQHPGYSRMPQHDN